jgi:carbamoyltransferase
MRSTYILGISCYYHDSAAVLLRDGFISAAAQEERFTRKKHDDAFPRHAVRSCLSQAGVTIADVDYVIFYDKPFTKFERILQIAVDHWPMGYCQFMQAMPIWLKEKLWIKQKIAEELSYDGIILFSEHHLSHAASAYLSSSFDDATIVTLDGVGEWETTAVGFGEGNDIRLTQVIHFPHSLGLLYSAVTGYLGFKVNSAEYKVMGLAPYGDPHAYLDKMRELIDLKEDGSYRLNMEYFAYTYGLRMTSGAFHRLFGGAPRVPEAPLTQRHRDIAAALQMVTEEVVLRIVRHAYEEHPSRNLCMAGGVALNCVANGRILREGPFENIFVQPAAGDAGGALGAAQYLWHAVLGHGKTGGTMMTHASLGPEYSDSEVETYLRSPRSGVRRPNGDLRWTHFDSDEALVEHVASLIDGENVIGWFQGRMEFGPRALGNRSIIADARRRENWQRVNVKIKFRESFRPFAPAVLAGKASEWFDLHCESPYMLLVADVRRNDIPAVTHVDGSARIQTVRRDQNPLYHDLIQAFYERTGCPVIINTSFNIRGEPIVCTPGDALRCFLATDMDYLVLGRFVLNKRDNVHVADMSDQEKYLGQFELD